MTLGSLIYYSQTLLYYIALDNTKDYTRIASIFVFPIVSDWTNVFIVTWLSDMCLLTIYHHEGDEVLLQFAKAKSQCLDWVKHFSIFMYLYTYQFVNILVIEILCNFCFFNNEIINFGIKSVFNSCNVMCSIPC